MADNTDEQIEITSRYDVFGQPPENACTGECEATGVVPIKNAAFGHLIRTDGPMNDAARELVEQINQREMLAEHDIDPEYAEDWWKVHNGAHLPSLRYAPKQMIVGWNYGPWSLKLLRRPWKVRVGLRELLKYWWWLWFNKERLECDGWHFITCNRCHGTRMEPTT